MKKEKSLAVQGSTIAVNIEKINKEIAKMKEIETSQWLSNGKLHLAGSTIDIKTETSIEKLVKGYANVKLGAKAAEDAYAELGIDSYPVIKVNDNTVDAVKADVILRIKIIQQKDRLDQMKELKDKFEKLMDKEDRKALLEEKMNNFLSTID